MPAVRPTSGSPERLRTPVRTCLGCRRRDEQHALLRVVAERSSAQPPGGWALVPDEQRRSPGRGAYVHPTPECVQTAVQRQAFGRALRQTGRPENTALQEWLARRR